MASQNDSGFRTFLLTGSAGISAFQAVNVNVDGTISPCANAVKGIGVINEALGTSTPNQYGKVKLWTAAGTFMLACTGTPITPGNTYSIVTNGYAGVATGSVTTGTNPPFVLALTSAAAGGVAEFTTQFSF
jgi:hypothetical protein